MKRIGPRTEPCGTPYGELREEEDWPEQRTEKDREER
jgi:hypothetical protein